MKSVLASTKLIQTPKGWEGLFPKERGLLMTARKQHLSRGQAPTKYRNQSRNQQTRRETTRLFSGQAAADSMTLA